MAFYNNGFPATYQPMYQYQQQQPQNGIIWVSGEAGAKAYLVAPNTTVQLWDSEAQRIYLKSADASGMPSIKVLDYTIISPQNPHPDAVKAQEQYLTKDALTPVYEQISAIKTRIDKLTEVEHG